MKSDISVTTVVQKKGSTTVIHTRKFSDTEIKYALEKEDLFHVCLQAVYQVHLQSKTPAYIIPGPGGNGTF